MTETIDQVDEIKILFSDEQVGEYTIRPWSLEQFGRLMGVLMELMNGFSAQGVSPDGAGDLLLDPQAAMQLLPTLTPLFPEIIAITLGFTREQVDQIEVGTQMALGLRILLNKENQKQLKNFLGGLLGLQKNPPAATH
jgi:hypothetical protein